MTIEIYPNDYKTLYCHKVKSPLILFTYSVINGNQSRFTSKIVGRAEVLLVLSVFSILQKNKFLTNCLCPIWQSNPEAKFYYCVQF